MNGQTGKEMHVNLVKYHVYQQIMSDEQKDRIQMLWGEIERIIFGGILKINSETFAVTSYQHLYCLFLLYFTLFIY